MLNPEQVEDLKNHMRTLAHFLPDADPPATNG
jgi:hypothetical protein